MHRQRNDLQYKKQAMRSQIRNEWLNNHFRTIRTSIIQNQQIQQDIKDRLKQMIEDLPNTIAVIAQESANQLQIVGPVLLGKIDVIADKMIKLTYVEWSYYIYVVIRLLSYASRKEDLVLAIGQTLLPLLEGGEVLACKLKSQDKQYSQILESCLNYIVRLGRYVLRLNQLEEQALVAILCRLWRKEYEGEHQRILVVLCNNLLCADWDSDQSQNVTPQQQTDLQLLKISLIQHMFYQNEDILHILITRCFTHSFQGCKHDALQLYLRLLINITHFLSNSVYYYPLLKQNITHLINTLLIQPQQSIAVIILTVRLLNNLVLNQTSLTENIMKQIMVSSLIKVHRRYEFNLEIQIELVELFSNLIHFMCEDQELIRNLIQFQVDDLIFGVLAYAEDIGEDITMRVLTSILILINHHPLHIKCKLKQHHTRLQILMEEMQVCTEMVQHLLININQGNTI